MNDYAAAQSLIAATRRMHDFARLVDWLAQNRPTPSTDMLAVVSRLQVDGIDTEAATASQDDMTAMMQALIRRMESASDTAHDAIAPRIDEIVRSRSIAGPVELSPFVAPCWCNLASVAAQGLIDEWERAVAIGDDRSEACGRLLTAVPKFDDRKLAAGVTAELPAAGGIISAEGTYTIGQLLADLASVAALHMRADKSFAAAGASPYRKDSPEAFHFMQGHKWRHEATCLAQSCCTRSGVDPVQVACEAKTGQFDAATLKMLRDGLAVETGKTIVELNSLTPEQFTGLLSAPQPPVAAIANADQPAATELTLEPELSGEAKALALLVQHPDWTDVQIADAAGCSRTSLYRWSKYVAARKAQSARSMIPRGTKDRSSRTVEAIDDDD